MPTPPFWLVGGFKNGSTGFSPFTLSKVAVWIRHTQTTGDLVSWPSQLDSNHATANVARAPAAGASAGNAQPLATWTSTNNDAIRLGINAAVLPSGTTKWWVRGWFRQPTSALETLFAIFNGTNGASTRTLFLQTNTSRRLVLGVYDAGLGVRTATSPLNALPAAGSWFWAAGIFDGALVGDARLALKIGGVAQIPTYAGAGVPPAALNNATGNLLIGNLNDGVSSTAFNGDVASNVFIGRDDLTADEETNLMNFERPT